VSDQVTSDQTTSDQTTSDQTTSDQTTSDQPNAVVEGAATARRRAKLDLDELARLEEERRFLLRSIADLEREYAAGDVEQADYDELMEGYTARAAAVLRTIEHGRAALPAKRRTKPAVMVAWVLGTIAVAVLAGWLLARSSGQRMAGEEMTGGQPADEVAVALTEARTLLGQQDLAGAFERFQRVTEIEPDNAEARTYTAWILVLNSRFIDDEAVLQTSLDAAMTAFASVIADEPRYADAHCLYAVTAANFLPEPDLEIAREHGSLCLENDPPSAIEGLVQQFLAGLDSTTEPTGTTVP
jgi:tetratricopeptide (TPR) repeat protein